LNILLYILYVILLSHRHSLGPPLSKSVVKFRTWSPLFEVLEENMRRWFTFEIHNINLQGVRDSARDGHLNLVNQLWEQTVSDDFGYWALIGSTDVQVV
jgi:hypothetical protein